MAKSYTVTVIQVPETRGYKVVEPALELEAATFEEIVKLLPAAAGDAFNLPPGDEPPALEIRVMVAAPAPTGPTGPSGTTGPTGTTGASGPTGTF